MTVTATRTWTGSFTQTTTLPYDPEIDETVSILVEIPIPTVTSSTTYDGSTISYTTVTAEPGGTATIIEFIPEEEQIPGLLHTVTRTRTWTGTSTQTIMLPYDREVDETVTVIVEVPIPTVTVTTTYGGTGTSYTTVTVGPGETATVIELVPEEKPEPGELNTVTNTSTWTGTDTELTTFPYDPEVDKTVTVVELVPIPTVTSSTTYDGSTVSYTTVTVEPGETATVIEFHPVDETGQPRGHSPDTATETRTWTGSFTQTTTLPYDSEIDGTVSVVVEVPIPTVTSTTAYDGSTISYTTVTAEPGETATIIEYHPSVYTGKAEILSGWESQLEAENPTSSHEFSGNKEEVTIQELQETQTEQSIISEQLLDTEGSLETEHLIETEEQSGTEEVLPTTILQNLPTEKPFETEESPESKAITSTEMLPRIQVLSESVIASEMEQPDYSEEYTKNQPPPSTDLSFDNEIPAQTHVSFVTEQAAESGALGVDTVTETKTWTGEFTQIYTLSFDPEIAETITVIVEIPIPTVTITSTYEGSTISYTTFTADPGDTATVIEFHPDEKTGEVEISPGWEQPFETESVPESEEQFRTMEGSAYVLQETQIVQPVATEQVLEIEETLETKEVIFTEAIPEPQMLSNTEIFSETLQPYNTDEVVEPQVLTATEVPLDTEIVDQSEVLPVTETEGETGSYAVDTVTETRTWTGVFTQSYTLSFIPEVDGTITVIVEVPIPTVTVTTTYAESITSYTTILAEPGDTATVIEYIPVGETEEPAEIEEPILTPSGGFLDTLTTTRTWTGDFTQSITLPFDPQIDQTMTIIVEIPIPTITITTTYDGDTTSYTTVTVEPGETATVIEYVPDDEGEIILETQNPNKTEELWTPLTASEAKIGSIDTVTETHTWTGEFTKLRTISYDPEIDETVTVIEEVPIPTVTVTSTYDGFTTSYTTIIVEPGETATVIEFAPEMATEEPIKTGEVGIRSLVTITETKTWTGAFTQITTLPYDPDIDDNITVIEEVPIPTVTMTTTYDGSTNSYSTVTVEPGETATVIEYVPVLESGEPIVTGEYIESGINIESGEPITSFENVETSEPIEPGEPFGRSLNVVTETRTWTGSFTQSTTLPFDFEVDTIMTILVEVPMPTVTITSTYDKSFVTYSTMTAEPGETVTVIEFVPGIVEMGISLESGVVLESGVPESGVPESGIPESGVPETDVPETGIPESGVPETVVPETGVPETGVTPDTDVPETGVPETGIHVLGTITETHTWTGLYTETTTLPFNLEVDETITVIVVVPIPTVTITSTYEGLTTSYTTIVAELGQTATIVEFVPENGSVFESSIPAETIKAETATIPEKPGVHSFDTVTETRTWTGIYTHSTTLPYNPEVDETVSVIIEVPIPTVTVTTTYDGSVTSYTTVLAEPGLTATVIEFIPDGEESVGRIIDIVTVTRTWTGTFTQLTTLPFDPDIDKTISVIVEVPTPTETRTTTNDGIGTSYTTESAKSGQNSTFIELHPSPEGLTLSSENTGVSLATTTETRTWTGSFTQEITLPFDPDIHKTITIIVEIPIPTLTITTVYERISTSYTTISAKPGETATVIEYHPGAPPTGVISTDDKGGLHHVTISRTRTWTGMITQTITQPFNPDMDETITVFVEVPIPTVSVTSKYDGNVTSYSTITANPGQTATVIEYIPGSAPPTGESVPRKLVTVTSTRMWTGLTARTITLPFNSKIDGTMSVIVETPIPTVTERSTYNGQSNLFKTVTSGVEKTVIVTEYYTRPGPGLPGTNFVTRSYNSKTTIISTVPFRSGVDNSKTVIVQVPVPTVTTRSTYSGKVTSYSTQSANPGSTARVIEYVPQSAGGAGGAVGSPGGGAGARQPRTITQTSKYSGQTRRTSTLPFNSKVDSAKTVVVQVPNQVTDTRTYNGKTVSYSTRAGKAGAPDTVLEYRPVDQGSTKPTSRQGSGIGTSSALRNGSERGNTRGISVTPGSGTMVGRSSALEGSGNGWATSQTLRSERTGEAATGRGSGQDTSRGEDSRIGGTVPPELISADSGRESSSGVSKLIVVLAGVFNVIVFTF
nr:agglutinin-like protein [Spathaspora passalidarum]